MATFEEQVDETRQAFRELADSGKEWVQLEEEVARRVLVNRRRQQRERRSRAANSVADLFFGRGAGMSGRIPFRYRHQAQTAASQLEAAGEIEHRFLDAEGNLRKDPPGRRDYRDRRYRLVPEAAGNSETSPMDRFEGLARRIEALPIAQAARGKEGQDATMAIHETEVRRLGFTLGVPDPAVKFYATVGYLPGREAGAEEASGDREPGVISVASYTSGYEPVYASVAADKLSGNSPDPDALHALDALESAVGIMELSQQADMTEEQMASAYARFFAPEGLALPSVEFQTPPEAVA